MDELTLDWTVYVLSTKICENLSLVSVRKGIFLVNYEKSRLTTANPHHGRGKVALSAAQSHWLCWKVGTCSE